RSHTATGQPQTNPSACTRPRRSFDRSCQTTRKRPGVGGKKFGELRASQCRVSFARGLIECIPGLKKVTCPARTRFEERIRFRTVRFPVQRLTDRRASGHQQLPSNSRAQATSSKL